ncbi:MAG: serine/threonine protein kinase [Planctomycetes bacterium]|nr:serine/threonine protein kinase [Planctomycetota bacterium]
MIQPDAAGDLYAFMRGSDHAPSLEGEVLPGGIRVQAPLGRGGMGAVYRATDAAGRALAVKVLLPGIAADPEARERARREVEILRRLAGPGVPCVAAEGEWEGAPFFAWDLLEGVTLAELLEAEAPLPADRAVRIARRVLEVLGRAHRRGVVHRDLKPGNVLLGKDDQPTLLDFGISKVRAPAPSGGDAGLGADAARTRAGQGLGTPVYSAPEQLDDAATASARADLYSVGVLLYEMLTGRPFGEWRGADRQRRQRAALELAGCPPHVLRAVLKAVRPVPRQRFLRAGSFSLALAGRWTPPALLLASAERGVPLAATLAAAAAAAFTLLYVSERGRRLELEALARLREVELDSAHAEARALSAQLETIKRVVVPAADPSVVRKEAEEIWQDFRALLDKPPGEGRAALRRLLERCQDFHRVEREPRYESIRRLREALEWRASPRRFVLTVCSRAAAAGDAPRHKLRVRLERDGKSLAWETTKRTWLELPPGAKTADVLTVEWNAFEPLALLAQEEGWLYGWNELPALSPSSRAATAASAEPSARIDTWTALHVPTDPKANPFFDVEVRLLDGPPPAWPAPPR